MVAQNDREDLKADKAPVKKAQATEPPATRITGSPGRKAAGKREALATTKNISPRKSAKAAGEPAVTNAKLLTILVEFNPTANDDFSGFERPNDPTTRLAA